MKLSKILRSALVALVACVLAFAVTACGNNEEEAVREAVDAQMASFLNVAESDLVSQLDEESIATLQEYGVDAVEYYTHCFKNFSYEITDVTVDGDTATVTLNVTNANLGEALNAAGEDFGVFAASDEATELYQSEGEEALFAKLFEYLYARLDAEDVELVTTEAQLTLTKGEEGWTVDGFSDSFISAVYGGTDISAEL